MDSAIAGPTAHHSAAKPGDKDQKLWKLAQDLEVGFLSEMLKSAGLGQSRGVMGGGAGEDQFSSFLVREYASAAVASGGLGLSESIYRSLLGAEARGR